MRVLAIVALVAAASASVAAQAPAPAWRLDAGGTALVEAWDLNGRREALAGAAAGVERRLWRALGLRVEGLVLRVAQSPRAVWVAAATAGPRARWRRGRLHPFVDLGFGVSQASGDTPPGGTAANFVIVAGGGVGVPLGRVSLDLGARWLHLSNNGREGRARNPDIQSLGVTAAIGWNP